MSNTAASVISIAANEVGYSRWTDPNTGTKYGRWYAEKTGYSYFGQNGVPYCAMLVSWCFDQAGASATGLPGAYCPTMLLAGKNAGKAVSVTNAKYGDIVYFDWEGDGITEHVGLVEYNSGSYLQTIEGNTGNGQVLRRTRSYGVVSGVIRPNYGSDSSSSSTLSGDLSVDGYWGQLTTKAVQSALGTTVDGIVSEQYDIYREDNPGLESASWEWKANPQGGSDMVRAIQSKVGSNVDGFIGPNTIKALQKYLGTTADGCISGPSLCVKELQRRLNAGTF